MAYDDTTAATDQQESRPPDGSGATVASVRVKTLRAKTLLIVVATLLGLIVVLYLPLRIILLGSFLSLEQQDIRQHVERAANALNDDIATLERTAADYAGWDDTYAFMQDHNQEYITANYVDQTLVTNRLNLVLLIDATGTVLFGKALDLATGREQPIPEHLRAFSANDPLLRHPSIDSHIAGIVLLPDGPMLIASQPILTSDYTGPSRGTLLMGRRLDMAEVQRLAETTRLSLGFYRPADPQAPADIPTIQATLTTATTPIEQPLSEEVIAGYILLPDIYGTPGLILRVETSRHIYAQGKASALYFIVSLLATGLAFGLVIMILLERIVLSRLTRLSVDVRQISASSDLTARVAVAGNDEIALFANTINGMLGTLEQAQAERRQAAEERAQLQEEMVRAGEQFMQMVVHDLKTPLTALTGFLDMLNMTRLLPDQHMMVESARRSSSGMNNLIATILDTGQLAEGRLKVRSEPTDIAALLYDCADDLSSWAEQDMHRIEVDLPQNMPPLLLDSRLMERVVINLLSNGIKHTPLGTTITLGARVDDTGPHLWVHDDGPGIPAAQQRGLFERFSATADRSSRQANTGLGLAFCKLAVEAHNGSISAHSAPGHGTTFTIALPIETIGAELDAADIAIQADVEQYEPV
jgi:sensor domain CHASE-containing protein/nitrogen-specific signal transduction histidine kinase